jgi:hypothetical protein
MNPLFRVSKWTILIFPYLKACQLSTSAAPVCKHWQFTAHSCDTVLFLWIVLFYVLFVSTVLFTVLFVCKCVLYYCYRVSTQLHLTYISYHISIQNVVLMDTEYPRNAPSVHLQYLLFSRQLSQMDNAEQSLSFMYDLTKRRMCGNQTRSTFKMVTHQSRHYCMQYTGC